MHSLQVAPRDAEQTYNPWRSRPNDDTSALSTTTARTRPLDDPGPVFHDDALLLPRRTSSQDRDMILSPSPPPQPQPAPQIYAQPPTEAADTTQTDPHVASLKAIFPDFDDTVILSVLESTHFDHDRALDALLGMSDPSFVPPAAAQPPDQDPSAPNPGAQRLSQEALDEQLARRLALEEEQLARQSWSPQAAEGQAAYQAYQPRRGRNAWGTDQPQGQPQTTQGQGGRDTMAEFQEGFTRIAESGKKTFSSLMSKVRAKMQEFDQGQGWSGSQTPPPGQPAQSGSSSYHPSYPQGEQQGYGPSAYASPSPSAPGPTSAYTPSPPRSGVLRPEPAPAPSANTQQSSYYDPNAQGYDLYGDDEEPIQIVDNTTPPPAAAAAPAPATTQNPIPTTPPQTESAASLSRSGSLPSYSATASPASTVKPSVTPPARSLSPTIAGPPGARPGAPGGVDFSKLGLLPKRPISLVRPQSPPTAGAGAGLSAPRVAAVPSESTTASSTDREEPEFVENPFEDR